MRGKERTTYLESLLLSEDSVGSVNEGVKHLRRLMGS